MSLNELQALEFPKLGTEALVRKISKLRKTTLRKSKLTLRRSQAKTIAYFKNQYYVNTAAADLKIAVRRNEDILLASLILTLSLYFAFMNMSGEAMLLFFRTGYDIAELSGINMAVLLLVVCSILAVIGSWLAALLLNMLSFSVMDGANRKKYRSFRSTARKGLQYASRVTGAWIALALVIALPLAVIFINSFLILKGARVPMVALETLFPYIATISVASTVLLLINYGLVPYVALFEPELPLYKALDRSHRLVKHRGRIFILAMYGILAACLAAIYGGAILLNQLLKMPEPITFFILSGVAAMYLNCLMVMFYRKRKQARK
jgi:hypothetical protein